MCCFRIAALVAGGMLTARARSLFAFIMLLGLAELAFMRGRFDFILTWAGRGISLFMYVSSTY